jgi:hypothetical protein
VPIEHDPEKWVPVSPRDKREAFAPRSCSQTKNRASRLNSNEALSLYLMRFIRTDRYPLRIKCSAGVACKRTA